MSSERIKDLPLTSPQQISPSKPPSSLIASSRDKLDDKHKIYCHNKPVISTLFNLGTPHQVTRVILNSKEICGKSSHNVYDEHI